MLPCSRSRNGSFIKSFAPDPNAYLEQLAAHNYSEGTIEGRRDAISRLSPDSLPPLPGLSIPAEVHHCPVADTVLLGEEATHSAGDITWPRRLDRTSITNNSNTVKITSKGQVTIPLRIREYLGIAPHAEVDFRIHEGAVLLTKHDRKSGHPGRFAALRGALGNGRTTREWMRATRES